jgi:xanthosine utilization system XapX-like protein
MEARRMPSQKDTDVKRDTKRFWAIRNSEPACARAGISTVLCLESPESLRVCAGPCPSVIEAILWGGAWLAMLGASLLVAWVFVLLLIAAVPAVASMLFGRQTVRVGRTVMRAEWNIWFLSRVTLICVADVVSVEYGCWHGELGVFAVTEREVVRLCGGYSRRETSETVQRISHRVRVATHSTHFATKAPSTA